MKKRIIAAAVCIILLAAMYVFAAYSQIPFIAKWRTIYIETALSTLEHRWLATALLPNNVWKPVELQLQAAEQAQIGLQSQWSADHVSYEQTTITDRTSFFKVFHQIDIHSMDNYLRSSPQVALQGWSSLQLFSESGLGIQTIYGDELLAIDVPNRLLLLKVKWGNCTGAMAICIDPARLSLCASSQIGSAGETTGQIAMANGGILSIPASAFDGANDGGNGGTLAGYAMCSGTAYGEHLAPGNKRLEIHQDHLFYIKDATDQVSDRCDNAVEFRPALIIDGKTIVDEIWSGLHPRVCIGQTERAEVLMLVMEGRLNGSSSLGASLTDCAEFLKRYGCMQAMNLDGGNSAMLWYNGICITRCSDISNPEGRPVPTAFVYG